MKRIPLICLALLSLVAASRESAANPQNSLLATNVTDAKLAPGFALAVEPHKIISRVTSHRVRALHSAFQD